MTSLQFLPSMRLPPFAPLPFVIAASFVALGWLAIFDMLGTAIFLPENGSLGPGMATASAIFLMMKGIRIELWQSLCIADVAPSFSWVSWSQFCSMGAIMTLAMMLPCATPAWRMLKTGCSAATGFAFLGGYSVIWILFSLVLATIDMTLHLHVGSHLVSTAGMTGVVAAGAIIGAGAFQWTPIKNSARLKIATGKVLASHSNESICASFAAGLRYAGCCVKSNGPLMMTMIFLGMMNIVAMALLLLAMILEKGVVRNRVSHGIGIALVLAGSTWAYWAATA
ncbi:DUF2182 domain-containing protein [Rhizobium sp. CECT 9324]|uniref:copper chaperone n=1 Tax=Rhizobium sp. CECT 9324 TaxID=2845820 RepID=UPI001E4D70DE|nr:DUF2182 domain-containing protein [Rhizobium sp. CECT 9324]CAH0340927.1 hypothetical protein RHI9324_02609 [Rhizobium sp. CECT 9324]